MEVKPGYKLTEVGVIPEDWEVLPLAATVDFLDGQRRPVNDNDRAKVRGDIPYYGASGIVDYVDNFIFDDTLILLGEDGENILSRNCRLAFIISGKAWVNNHAHVLKPRHGYDIGFLAEYLESLEYEQYNTGTAQPKLNKQVCSKIPVLRPPLPEQTAIATALSDVDSLISSLDALISKKKQIKQGAMQELLSGKRRLPGFSGEWEVKRLGDVAPLQRGFDLPTTQIKPGTYPVVYSNGVLNHHSAYQVKGPGIITGRSGTIGKVTIINEDYWPHNTSLWVTSLKGNDVLFVYYLFICIELERFATGSGVPTLNRNDVHEYSVTLPPLPEQQAIAAILSDMDAKITTLESRRNKTKLLKQGMMQELLTGRIRLIPPAAHAVSA
ncbi:restriction endonuclease subunit S [Acidithiobacillus ferrivorans]|nr:restriction endonuclease subunit S [Acidithiobacillus ferrivorans]